MDKECRDGLMGLTIKESSLKMPFMVRVNTNGKMVVSTTELGKVGTCMALGR